MNYKYFLNSFIVILLVIFIGSLFPLNPYRSFIVLTGSMGKSLPVGSVIFEKRKSHYRKGDIVTFQTNHSYITHRIVSIVTHDTDMYYKTQGDANNGIDTHEVSEKEIQGTVIFQTSGVFILFGLVTVFYVYFFIEQSNKKRTDHDIKVISKL